MSTPAGQYPSQSKTNPIQDEDVTLPPLSKPASSEAEVQTIVDQAGSDVAPSVAQRPPNRIDEGSMLGPYQILRKLGQGGMGSVYQARHTKLKKMVAIKILPPEFTRSPVLLSTDLVNARALLEQSPKTLELIETCEVESPFAVKVFGSDVGTMCEAARLLEARGVDSIDINMGCPVRWIVAHGSGASMMCRLDETLVRSVVEAVRIRGITALRP